MANKMMMMMMMMITGYTDIAILSIIYDLVNAI